MILIGSRAAKYHFPNFRKIGNDVDLICTEEEIDLLSMRAEAVGKPVPGKKHLYVNNVHIEAEVAYNNNSSQDLLPHVVDTIKVDGLGDIKFDVVSPEVLLLLKKSHISFNINWMKTFNDYHFFMNEGISVPDYLLPVLNKRIEETKTRIGFKEHDFDIDNDKFFEKSSHVVERIIPHDMIHELVKFNDRPMFEYIKKDKSKAEISFEMFNELPLEMKIQNMQEECMALASERHIVKSYVRKMPFSERMACRDILQKMCYNFLPFDFRFFAIDYFYVILESIPYGFSDKITGYIDENLSF